ELKLALAHDAGSCSAYLYALLPAAPAPALKRPFGCCYCLPHMGAVAGWKVPKHYPCVQRRLVCHCLRGSYLPATNHHCIFSAKLRPCLLKCPLVLVVELPF